MTIHTSINPYFVGKLAKDAPDQAWGAFNGLFEPKILSLDELAAHIQAGRSISAVCRGKRKTENFIERQDIGLDFDTEDKRSTLDALQADPFIAQHGALLHTTSSHTEDRPRARVLFTLEEPIRDPNQYQKAAQALNWVFGTSDAQCHDPARVWFGSIGCELRILGNQLSTAILDQLIDAWQAAQPPSTERTTERTTDAHTLLDQALKDGSAGNRNLAGFTLARRLRDAGFTIDQARETMLDYQTAVERLGNHPYLVREATDSLSSAYKHKPKIDAQIDALESAVMTGALSIPANVQKTYFGILTLARKTGKTTLALSLRSIEAACFGYVDKSTVANHLSTLVDAGLLTLKRKSNHRSGSIYTLQCVKVGHSHQETPFTALSVQTLRISTYHTLQAEPLCAIRAQIHPLMARDDAELIHSFGASAQRILTALITSPDGFDSLDALQEEVFLSRSTTGRKVAYLAAHQIVDVVKVGTHVHVKLNRFWRENIEAISPALTSFGQDLLRTERAAQQMISHHSHMADYTANPDEKTMCEETIKRAKLRIHALQAHKIEAMNNRRAWLQSIGLDPATAPALSLYPRSNPKTMIKLCLGSADIKKHLPPGNRRTQLKAYRRKKARLTPSAAAKSKQNGLIKAEREVIRIQLGSIFDESFGQQIEIHQNRTEPA